jgi:hypothetical protein
MKILLSLISEQSIPNILVIKSMPAIDRYLFLCSQRMKDSGRLADLCEVCNIRDFDVLDISEHDYLEVKTKLQSAVSGYPGHTTYLVNITGGTKIMALAVFDAMAHYRTQILYLPPFTEAANLIYPSVIPGFLPISHQLDAIRFLMAYGLKAEYDECAAMPNNDALFRYIASAANKELLQWINQLGSKTEDASLRRKYLPDLCKLLGQASDWIPDESGRQYLKGAWFESYLAHWLQRAIPGSPIYTNVLINRESSDNELDLAFCHKNVLSVIEVKTSISKTQDVKDFLYKLDSLGKKFGLYPRRCLAIADRLSQQNLQRSPHALQRAQEMGIAVFLYTDLKPENIENTLLRWINN